MEGMAQMKAFYHKKRVLVTGHTGFKGTWLCRWLLAMGAQVWGYALPPLENSLFTLLPWENDFFSQYGDICEKSHLQETIQTAQPEIVFHLAAQPLVAEGYANPYQTYQTNLMGTVNVLDILRSCQSVRSIVVVTTDKVYASHTKPHQESDILDGFDPYANSKSCAELATACFARCYFTKQAAVSTVRAGNVIGGGDTAAHRLLPDCVRAACCKIPVSLRAPYSIRPYQHVLEPLCAYLWTAWKQWETPQLAGCYNVAPKEAHFWSNQEIAEAFCHAWGEGMTWCVDTQANFAPEQEILCLSGEKIKKVLGWSPQWDTQTAIQQTVAWEKVRRAQGDCMAEMLQQIQMYEKGEMECGKQTQEQRF